MSFIAIAVAVVAFFMVQRLKERVRSLEQRLQQKESAQAPAPAHAPTAPQGAILPTVLPAPTPAVPAQSAPASPPPPSDGAFIEWLKDNWLLKLGALFLLMGFGWLVTYAFLNNWIGPAGRITLGLAAGALILALGFWRSRAYVRQGSIFIALGATVVLLTTYAGRSLYDFFTPASALALMFGTSMLVALASGLFNRKQLGVASVLLAGVAPLLTNSPESDYFLLFAYLLAVVVGALWVVIWKDFREVVLAALVVVALYSGPYLSGIQSADMGILLIFGYVFAAVFYLANTAGLMRLKGVDGSADMVTAAGNALLLIAWIYVAAPETWQSLIISAWAAVFMVGSFIIFRASGRSEPLFLYAAVGVGYIAAATAIELDGTALTVAYILESAAVAVGLYLLTRDVSIAQRSTLLLAGPVGLSFASITASVWRTSMFINEHFFVLALLSLTFFGLGGLFYRGAHATGKSDVVSGNGVLLVVGSIYAYILLWLSLHSAFLLYSDIAVMLALFVYTVVGITAYLLGATGGRKGLRAYGGMLLGFVVARLLIVDVWQMAITGRIITFFLIGALLMSTAFLGKKPRTTAPAQPHENA